jgi:hypothetical protein
MRATFSAPGNREVKKHLLILRVATPVPLEVAGKPSTRRGPSQSCKHEARGPHRLVQDAAAWAARCFRPAKAGGRNSKQHYFAGSSPVCFDLRWQNDRG